MNIACKYNMLNPQMFTETYKNNTQLLPEIPNDLSIVDKARWIAKQKFGYIAINKTFNVDEWIRESKVAEPYYVPHREGDNHLGWESCCIHGLGVDKTGVWNRYYEIEPEYNWTELSELTPVIKQFWQEFPFEKLLRVRFMRVAPGGYVYPHNDSPSNVGDINLLDHIIPINISIIHPKDCTMTLKNFGNIPWTKGGQIFLINITNEHTVVNNSAYNRIHMIGHGIIGNKINEFSELLVNSYERTRV